MPTPKKITSNKINKVFITPQSTTFLPYSPSTLRINLTILIIHRKIC